MEKSQLLEKTAFATSQNPPHFSACSIYFFKDMLPSLSEILRRVAQRGRRRGAVKKSNIPSLSYFD
jgi:hypothetical protein